VNPCCWEQTGVMLMREICGGVGCVGSRHGTKPTLRRRRELGFDGQLFEWRQPRAELKLHDVRGWGEALAGLSCRGGSCMRADGHKQLPLAAGLQRG
jgi:hypothetical protein